MVHRILVFLPVVCSCVIKYLFMSPLVVCLSCEVCTFWSYALIIRSTLQGVCNPWLRGFSVNDIQVHMHMWLCCQIWKQMLALLLCALHTPCVSAEKPIQRE